jgi:transcriptional regulator with XRE-family HTH domain
MTRVMQVQLPITRAQRTQPDVLIAHLCFGALLFELRQKRQLSQRQLAQRAGLAPSVVSELENTRRAPPTARVVGALSRALRVSPDECRLLAEVAEQERRGIGLKVGKTTPQHVADLLRDIAGLSHLLSPSQVSSVRAHLSEVSMK